MFWRADMGTAALTASATGMAYLSLQQALLHPTLCDKHLVPKLKRQHVDLPEAVPRISRRRSARSDGGPISLRLCPQPEP